jgi:hypothetical protein
VFDSCKFRKQLSNKERIIMDHLSSTTQRQGEVEAICFVNIESAFAFEEPTTMIRSSESTHPRAWVKLATRFERSLLSIRCRGSGLAVDDILCAKGNRLNVLIPRQQQARHNKDMPK